MSAQIRKCYICEKPSLGREVAAALAENNGVSVERGDGHLVVGQDVVAWFAGHMYGQAKPSVYYDGRWSTFGNIDALPVVVSDNDWKLEASPDKAAMIATARRLAKQAQIVVNVGDAGREGQLLIDEALIEWGIDAFGPNVERMWCQSVTRKDLLDAIRNVIPNVQKRGLYEAAVARARADWQHGMTYSPLYTTLARRSGANVTISVGRVQTPTLRLVVDRDRERANFKPVDHYLPEVTFKHANGSFAASWVIPANCDGLDSEDRLVDRAVAQAVCARISGKTGQVSDYKAVPTVKAPPLPYSIETLQSDCSRKLKLTAAETLAIAQSLYEKKVTSYPRTDSQYLPPSILEDEAPGIVAVLRTITPLDTIAAGADLTLKSAAWNAEKVSDHYGIIPTNEMSAAKVAGLSDNERAVFDLVARAFLAQFYQGFRFRKLSVAVSCEGERFTASGRQILDEGWRRVYGNGPAGEDDDEDEGIPSLPEMARGDAVAATTTKLLDKRTTAPAGFSDDTIIKAMAKAHLFESDPDIRARLKESDGIGRPATRANIIEVLIKRTFLKRKNKVGLESTELGRSIIDALPAELKSPGMTALWEAALERIEKGEVTTSQFLARQAEDLRRRVTEARGGGAVTVRGATTVKPLPGHGEKCTKCDEGSLFTKQFKSKKTGKLITALACSNYPKCTNTVFVDDVKPLPGHGKACTKCGTGKMNTRNLKMKDGSQKPVLACTSFPDCRNIEFVDEAVKPLPGHGKACTTCNKGTMNTRSIPKKDGSRSMALCCTNYPACRAIEWDNSGDRGKGGADGAKKFGSGRTTKVTA